jgi:hypothetical protein
MWSPIFKENREKSRKVSFAIALSRVETCLINDVDVILDKISKSGYDSLTKREKQVLFDQSK